MFKSIFLSLIVLFTTSGIVAQSITIINKTGSDKNSRTLYIGIENYLEIKDETFKGIVPQDGVVLEQNKLTVRPGKPGKLTITFLTNEGKLPLTFNVKTVSDAIIAIGGQTNKKVSKDLLLTKRELSLQPADNRDTLFDHFKVISFTAQLNGQTFEITGKDFSNELTGAIRNAKKGDILTINTVTALNEDISLTGKFEKSTYLK